MQIIVSQRDLAKTLAAAIGVVERRVTIPILANVLLSASGDALRIVGTDLDMEIDLGCPCQVDTPGRVTVQADVLAQLAKKFPDGSEIGLSVLEKEGRLRVSCGRSRFDLPMLPPEDFPAFGAELDGGMAIAPNMLRAALGRVRFAISTDETRYYLGGVYLHREDERLVFVATNGHVLALETLSLPPQAAGLPAAILPRKFVAEAMKLLPEEAGEDAYLAVTKTRVGLFLPDGTRLVSKLIDGTYPEYSRVIPRANHNLAELPRLATITAVQRAAVMLDNKGTMCVGLRLTPGALTVFGIDAARGSAVERLDIVYDGPPVEIGAKAGYLLDVLSRFGNDRIVVRFDTPGAPMLWRDADGDSPALAVLMPMTLGGALPVELAEERGFTPSDQGRDAA